jgi:hypothetical protein
MPPCSAARTLRLWSLHPRYLDPKGLGGVWREGLLAQAVLLGKTTGWRKHSHLLRFTSHPSPVRAIGCYLLTISEEAKTRGYHYRRVKILAPAYKVRPIPVTTGQLLYEWRLLKERVRTRSPPTYTALLTLETRESRPTPHPLFVLVEGDIEPWERAYWQRKQQPPEQSDGAK